MSIKLTRLGPNVSVLKMKDRAVLFSYDTPVAGFLAGVFVRSEVKYSKTTTKHINQWLGRLISAKVVPQSEIDALLETN